MRIIVFATLAEQVRGLQHRARIEDDTLFVFPGVAPGTEFHSRNVREPFDLAFLDKTYSVLAKKTITPEAETFTAPAGTALAIEARAGVLDRHGVRA